MEPATMSKVDVRRSPRNGRAMMGSKGVGRFAAAKLGETMSLLSISDRSGARTEVLIPRLDWSLFDGDTYLSDVAIDYLTQVTDLATGTTIEISGLRESWSETKLARLHLELRRLISPLNSGERSDFTIVLDLSECTPANSGFDGYALFGTNRRSRSTTAVEDQFKVEPFPLLTASDYEVVGQFDPDGKFTGTFEIKRAGDIAEPFTLSVPIEDDEEPCGPVGVHLYVFDREADVVRQAVRRAGLGDVTTTEARRILDSVAGIAIYRTDFRVRPYGDPENDWLVLDKRRVQNPSLRIGHNQVSGFITVSSQEESGLVERSSREGFEQGGQFRRLQRLVTELLARVVEPKRQIFREKAGISRGNSTSFAEVRKISELEELRSLVSAMPESKQGRATDLITRQSLLLAEKIGNLEERQRILEAQSSLGQIIGEILHEGAPSTTFLARTAARLRARYQHLFDASEHTAGARQEFPEKLALISEYAEKLQDLFAALRPISGGKRGSPEYFNGPEVAHSVRHLFTKDDIPIRIHAPRDNFPKLHGYPEDLSTALVNLIGNAVHWLQAAKTDDPAVDIRFSVVDDRISILVDDNGPGISEDFAEKVFEVGFTLKNGGTGLGLNIAREALARSDATLAFHMDHRPGTRFEIRFPR